MKKNNGFSLIGILLTIAVMAVFVMLVIRQYKAAKEQAIVREIVTDVRLIITNAREVFGSEDYWGIKEELEARAMLPPSWQVKQGGRYITKYGLATVAALEAWSTPSGFDATDGIFIFINRIPPGSCFDAVNELQNELDYLSVTGVPVKNYNLAFDRELLNQRCDDAMGRGYWVFRGGVYR